MTVVSDIWPPFVMESPDMPGVDVEVMNAVLDQLGYDVDFRIYPWKRAQLIAESGEADALLDVFITEPRKALYWFPDEPISSTETALFCQNCDPDQQVTEADFERRPLIINRGYQYARFGNNPNIRKFEVNNFEQGFKMLISGRADYYLVNRTVGQFTLNQMKLQYVHPLNMKIDDPSDVYLAFYRSEALKPISDAFARQLRQFKGTEAYQRILAKYGIQP
ncbi:MAG: transporter substrate-binding domain-containing protein [Reinekea sp.]|nr:transporter substrate-binding domain-containing protein [Reinekea sp.]